MRSMLAHLSMSSIFDMDDDSDAPARIEHGVLRGGRHHLVELWKRQEEIGVSHIALNLKPLRRSFDAVISELAEHVLPNFAPA